MESNSNEKKPKRPRIGQAFRVSESQGAEERPRYQRPEGSEDGDFRPKRPYQPRQQGGYNNGYQQRNNYNNNNNGYQPRPYQPRPLRPDFENGEERAEVQKNVKQQAVYLYTHDVLCKRQVTAA